MDNTIHQIGTPFTRVPPIKYGGTERVIANLTKELVNRGYRVVCYSPGEISIKNAVHRKTNSIPFMDLVRESRSEELSAIQSEVETNDLLDRWFKVHNEIVYQKLSDEWNPGDIIHFHQSRSAEFLMKELSDCDNRYAFVETAHSSDLGTSTNVIFPSVSLSKRLEEEGVIIPHGIDLDRYSSDATPTRDFLFFAGRPSASKGIKIAIEAAYEAGMELQIAGPDFPKNEGYLTDYPNIVFLGEITEDKLVKKYQQAQAFIYMSQYCEPFGLSAVEAMACGTPVITTGNGGTGETVIDGETGFFCKTVKEIVRALEKVEDISSKACLRRAEKYSISRMVDLHVDHYKNTLDRHCLVQ